MAEQYFLLSELSIDGKGSYGIGASAVPFSNDLYTYLRITDINDDGTLNLKNLKSVDDEKVKDYLLKPNDIVFARTGASTGRNYFYDGTDGEFVYAGFLIKFSIDPQKVNPKYVKYYCQSKQYKDWINSFNTGSTRGNINAQTLGKMPIPIIDRKKQDILVDIMSSIDEKIKQNSKINDNLEAAAMALFKSWFIDYEPFELDADGLPIGWEQITLEKKLFTSTQSVNPQKIQENYVWHYSIPAFDNEKLPTKDIPSSILSNKYVVPDNAILVSKLNPDTKRVWRALPCFKDAICSTEFIVFSPKVPKHRAFYYLMFNTKSFIDFLVSNATGSTNSRMRVKPASSLDYEFVCPTSSIIDDFCQKVEPLLSQIENNTLEIRKLNELKPFAVTKMMTSSR